MPKCFLPKCSHTTIFYGPKYSGSLTDPIDQGRITVYIRHADELPSLYQLLVYTLAACNEPCQSPCQARRKGFGAQCSSLVHTRSRSARCTSARRDRLGARALAVVSPRDGFSLFLHLLRWMEVFSAILSSWRRHLKARCTCPKACLYLRLDLAIFTSGGFASQAFRSRPCEMSFASWRCETEVGVQVMAPSPSKG